MEAHIHEWVNLAIRWIHFIVGVAWIGASFYFNWLENNLNRRQAENSGIAGTLWAVHGGGFYHLKKFSTGPEELPSDLHWFKWEAYTTWLSGFALLIVAYYFNARLFLIDTTVANLSPMVAILCSMAALAVSWLVYDALCKSSLRQRPYVLAALLIAYFSLLSLLLVNLFSARAAYIHVGAAIGTIMVANVFFGIIPAQKEMVSALQEKRPLDPTHGANGLLRSRHNNYLTLPVLFIMISGHFPSTYGHQWNWLVLILVSLISVAIRHYFNVRKSQPAMVWILPIAFVAMTAIMWFTAPKAVSNSDTQPVSTSEILSVVQARCSGCHAKKPTQPGFAAAPAGLVLESVDDIESHAARIYQSAVQTRYMPLANMTGITEPERAQLGNWYRTNFE